MAWSKPERLAAAFVLVIAVLPLLEPYGRWDHWLSWGLYAPRNSRVVVFVKGSDSFPLPAALRPFMEPARFEDPEWAQEFARLRLDEWSLRELSVPIYPQDRFHLGVSLAVANRLGGDNAIVTSVQSVANRFDGSRSETLLRGKLDMEKWAVRYWINAIPQGYDETADEWSARLPGEFAGMLLLRPSQP